MCKRFSIFVSMLVLFVFSISGVSFSQSITDEYGSGSSNYVLGGLGSPNAYANIPHNALFNLSLQGTLEMWIYAVPGSASQTIISKGSTANQSFLFGITNQILYFNIGSTNFVNTGGAAIQNYQWTHVAVTWAASGNYYVNFYVNGAASGSTVSAAAVWNNNTDAIRIGASQYYLGQYFSGKIDEVRLWNTVRTSQIAISRYIGIGDAANANANNSITSGVYYNGLIASWTFNSTSSVTEYINNLTGTYNGGAIAIFQDAGIPIPYNLAMRFPGGTYDYISVNTATIFNQTGDGSLEMWVKPTSFSADQTLISKGATGSNITFLFGITSAGKLLFRTAGNPVASNGPSLSLNKWNHVAVTWLAAGGNLNINFFLNGVANGTTVQIPNSIPANTDKLYIGSSQAMPNTPVNGYIDEIRIWGPALTEAAIQRNMFVSTKTLLSNTGLLAVYIFEGNLNNLTTQAGINASFSNVGTNNCRFSGYVNETSIGMYPSDLCSHPTTINRGGTPNSFPIGYNYKVTSIAIPDNLPAGITDTLNVTYPTGSLFSIEVFASIEHTYVGDLVVSLQGPNGTSKILLNRNGGGYDNVLTFFGDAFSNLPSVATYFPPWGFLKPMEAMGSFNGSTMHGNWILKCVDAAANDAGVLKGWGIRLNNSVNIETTSSEIPVKFNLSQNYPNPFNPVTNIKFDLAKDVNVKITLYDMLGREVKILADEFRQAGSYNLRLDGSILASGTYFYKITAGEFTDVKKMVLIK